MTKTIKIEGMSCAHCSGRVEKALNALAGIHAKVDLASKSATVSSEAEIDDLEIAAVVEDAGYAVVK